MHPCICVHEFYDEYRWGSQKDFVFCARTHTRNARVLDGVHGFLTASPLKCMPAAADVWYIARDVDENVTHTHTDVSEKKRNGLLYFTCYQFESSVWRLSECSCVCVCVWRTRGSSNLELNQRARSRELVVCSSSKYDVFTGQGATNNTQATHTFVVTVPRGSIPQHSLVLYNHSTMPQQLQQHNNTAGIVGRFELM